MDPAHESPEAAAPASRRTRSRVALAAPLVLVALVGAWPVLGGLGAQRLWEDEADTAVLARNVLRFGLPVAWDGVTFSDSDFGRRVTPRLFGTDFVVVGTPWLAYYAAAASFALFGESTAAARLPFAVAGLATVVLLCALVRRTTGDLRAALAASLLLLLSTQFLLYARECRSYPLNMLLTLVVLAAFLRLPARGASVALVLAAAALFHVQILPAAVVLAATGGLALFHPGFRPQLVPLLRCAPWVAALTVPWLVLSWSTTSTNWVPLRSSGELVPRFGQLVHEAGVAIPWLGWAVLMPWVLPRAKDGERRWLAVAGAFVVASLLLAPLVLSPALFAMLGLRYLAGLLPVAAGATGVLVARASAGRPLRFALLLLLFGATNLANGALFGFWLGETQRLPGGIVASVPREISAKLFNVSLWAFLRGIGTPDPGTASEVIDLLSQRARPGDVVVTNFSWENLYFYTGLPQGLRLPLDGPVRTAAREAGLPNYVFGVDDADWVVWRAAIGDIPGWGLARIERELAARGASLERVATLRETVWENRPELAARRFPGLGYPFAPHGVDPFAPRRLGAVVYRVRWPE
jgi:hypothetical protein